MKLFIKQPCRHAFLFSDSNCVVMANTVSRYLADGISIIEGCSSLDSSWMGSPTVMSVEVITW